MVSTKVFSFSGGNELPSGSFNTYMSHQAESNLHNSSQPTTTNTTTTTAPSKDDVDPSLAQPEWLITSPYTLPHHQLNLSILNPQDRLMSLALTTLTSSTPTYATSPYESAFNWPLVFTTLRSLCTLHNSPWSKSEFYVVEFRSKLKPDIDVELLYRLDKESHAEAAISGGLLKYWYGSLDGERRNLATCLWRNKEDAVKGGRGPWHKQARAIIPRMYEDIRIKGLRLVVEDDVSAWHFSPYS